MSVQRISPYLLALALLAAMLACNLPQNVPAAPTQPAALPQPSPTPILPLPSPAASPTPTPPPTPLPKMDSPTLPMLPPITNTPIPMATSAMALPSDTPTAIPSATLPPTQTPTAGGAISEPERSADRIYYNNTCGPQELTLSVTVSDPKVYSVFLFVRLKDKSSGDKTDWNDGIPMTPLGNGKFQATLPSEDIPAYTSYAEAWLQYQFVATDSQQNNLARSAVYAEVVTLSKCP